MGDRIASNRLILKSIISTIILCGRQNIPLRGHRDNSTDMERERERAQKIMATSMHFCGLDMKLETQFFAII